MSYPSVCPTFCQTKNLVNHSLSTPQIGAENSYLPFVVIKEARAIHTSHYEYLRTDQTLQ